MKVVCFKQYAGSGKTGGHLVFESICEAMSEIFSVEVKEFPIYDESSIKKKIRYLIDMRRCLRDAIKNGDQVYGLDRAGTIDYIQPVLYKSGFLGFMEIMKERLTLFYLAGFSDKRKACIFVSEYIRKSYKKGICKGPVIYPPLLENIQLDYSAKQDLILTISRISKEKNIEAVGNLSNKIDAKFVVIGFVTNKDMKYLEKLKKRYPNLTIIHNASSDVKQMYLRKAKILLHPTINEPYGMTKIEGMAAGCVPLVHRSGGNPENIPDGYTFRDLDEAEQKITEILRNYNMGTAVKMAEFVMDMNMNNFKQKIKQYLKGVL